MIRCIWYLLPLVISICLPSSAAARLFRGRCDIHDLPAIEVAEDPLTREFVIVDEWGKRNLTSLAAASVGENPLLSSDEEVRALKIIKMQTSDELDMRSWRRHYVRDCSCASSDYGNWFCPDSLPYCSTPHDLWNGDNYDRTPICFSEPRGQGVLRTAWPVVVVWLSAMILCLFTTKAGRGVFHYVASCFYPKWTYYEAGIMLRRDPERARSLLRDYWRRRRSEMDSSYQELIRDRPIGDETALDDVDIDGIDGGGDDDDDEEEVAEEAGMEAEVRGPRGLALRTRIYSADRTKMAAAAAATTGEEEKMLPSEGAVAGGDGGGGPLFREDLEVDCSICLIPLEEGDRIGALRCDHCFHAECLKAWLAKRNVCPLCLTERVAEPQYDVNKSEGRS